MERGLISEGTDVAHFWRTLWWPRGTHTAIDPESEPRPLQTPQGSADSSQAAARKSTSNGSVSTTVTQGMELEVGI